MKKIFSIVLLVCVSAVSALAVMVNDVAGVYNGSLKIAGSASTKDVYVLPGTVANTVTIVLPEFQYSGSWGDLVLTNIPMNASGALTLKTNVYIKSRSERAVINATMASVSSSKAELTMTITTPKLPGGIAVTFSGSKVTNRNYAITNGGFEGSWSNGEPSDWHSFNSATGGFSGFIKGTEQFSQSTDVRPGSAGSHSA